MSASIEDFYKTYYGYEIWSDILKAIYVCREHVQDLTRFVPAGHAGKFYTKDQYDSFLKSMGLESVTKDSSTPFEDKPFSISAMIMQDIEEPLQTTAYNMPFNVSAKEDPPTESEVIELTANLKNAVDYLNYHAHIEMGKIIIGESRGLYPPGTENRMLNVIAAIKQYIRYV